MTSRPKLSTRSSQTSPDAPLPQTQAPSPVLNPSTSNPSAMLVSPSPPATNRPPPRTPGRLSSTAYSSSTLSSTQFPTPPFSPPIPSSVPTTTIPTKTSPSFLQTSAIPSHCIPLLAKRFPSDPHAGGTSTALKLNNIYPGVPQKPFQLTTPPSSARASPTATSSAYWIAHAARNSGHLAEYAIEPTEHSSDAVYVYSSSHISIWLAS